MYACIFLHVCAPVCVNPPRRYLAQTAPVITDCAVTLCVCERAEKRWSTEERGVSVCVCGREGRVSLCLYLSHHPVQLSRGDTKVSVSALSPSPSHQHCLLPSLPSFSPLLLSLSFSLAVPLCTAQWQMEAVSAGRNGHSHTPYTHSPTLSFSVLLYRNEKFWPIWIADN